MADEAYRHRSEQVPLVWVYVTAGNEGFTQGGKLYFGNSKLVAAFVVRVPNMALEPLPGDTVARAGSFELSS